MNKFLFLLPILLIACTTPNTPAQTVFLVQSDYAAALRLELAYSNLPRCHKTTAKLCSDTSVIKTLQKADDTAWVAIKEAQTAVRTPSYGENKVTTVVASAKALTNAFVEITSKLKVK